MTPLRLTLVVTTYERPDALAAVLASVGRQTRAPDQLIVADDGSGEGTRAVIAAASESLSCPLTHVWQEHDGFRLTRLRNLAIARASGDYVLFVDGDMLLHPAFVADHARLARRGRYTQGVRILLDAASTTAALGAATPQFGPLAPGLGGLRRLYALHSPAASLAMRTAANTFIATKGCNQGFWRSDLLEANGFDEDIVGWGPEDKELCARLQHAGVRRQTLLFGGIAWHLHHPPAARHRVDANQRILATTLATGRTRCTHGVDAHLDRDPARPAS